MTRGKAFLCEHAFSLTIAVRLCGGAPIHVGLTMRQISEDEREEEEREQCCRPGDHKPENKR